MKNVKWEMKNEPFLTCKLAWALQVFTRWVRSVVPKLRGPSAIQPDRAAPLISLTGALPTPILQFQSHSRSSCSLATDGRYH